jgi:hypothetical protein
VSQATAARANGGLVDGWRSSFVQQTHTSQLTPLPCDDEPLRCREAQIGPAPRVLDPALGLRVESVPASLSSTAARNINRRPTPHYLAETLGLIIAPKARVFA